MLSASRRRICLWLLLATGMASVLGGLLYLDHRQVQRQAEADIGNLNLIFEARLNATLQGFQASLQAIALRIDDSLFSLPEGRAAGQRKLKALGSRFVEMGDFDVLASDGRLLLRTDDKSVEPSTDELHFWTSLTPQTDDERGLAPMVMGNDKGRDVLHMAVPVFDNQRRHIGWVAFSRPLKTMLDLFDQIDVGRHGVITVRRADRPDLVLRVPKADNPYRQYAADKIDQMIIKGEQQGKVVMPSRIDGIKRLYGFKRVGQFPLVIVTGLASEDYLASWKYTVIAAVLMFSVLLLAIFGLSQRLQRIRLRRQQVVDELRDSAFHDALTGLPNRRFLRERVNHCISACSAGQQRLALLYFDVDNFKTINDSLGHVSGDLILEGLAQRLMALQPEVGTVARLGGDEFLILVSDDNREHLVEVIERVLQAVREPFQIQDYRLGVSASIGVALYPEHGNDFGSLLKAADTALYQAKNNGRNTWAFYETAMGERGLWLLQIQTQLRNAHEQAELSIHYQPQVDLLTGRVIGAEALMRWWHPEKGAIPPSEFIPVAESSGLILPMSHWLLHEVCKQAMAWQRAGFGELTVAMNCSAVQFRQDGLVEQVRQALQDTGLKPSLLELELTESILIENSERVMTMIRDLKSLGVKMSIDDFGIGYSSMAYLKRFEVDKLKIDQSFVRGMLDDPKDAAIVRAVIGLGHSLDMTVIAEGIEHSGIVAALIDHGCDEAQGYHYAKPLAVADFHRYMLAHQQAIPA